MGADLVNCVLYTKAAVPDLNIVADYAEGLKLIQSWLSLSLVQPECIVIHACS